MLYQSAPAADRLQRVVLFHDFSQALGGASYLVQVLIAQLRRRGVLVTFFAGDDGSGFRRDDVDFIPLHGKPLLDRTRLSALTLGLYNRAVFSRVHDWIRRHDSPGTIYHLHGWSKILTPAVFGALRQVRERLILHAHDYFNGCPNGAFFNYTTERDCRLKPLSIPCLRTQCDKSSRAEKLWRSGREALRRELGGDVAGATRMLLIHPGQAANLKVAGWPAARLHAVRNPAAPPCADRVRAEENRGVVFIGRISTEKGADLAARAAAIAGVPLTFVGEGSAMGELRALNPKSVFLGRQDRAGVARALMRARLAVMPSRWSEPFGLVALEAIGSGVPVIVNDRALIAGEIAGAGLGVAMNTADVVAFATELMRLHADDACISAMSRAGHARYGELCNSEESWAEQILAHYQGVLAEAAVHQEMT